MGYRHPLQFAVLTLVLSAGADAAPAVTVGGMPPVTMHRKPTSHGHEREFTSITLLPGRGLNTFQITANLPGRGETELFRSPSLQEASEKMNEQGEDAFGNLNHAFGGAFLIPFTSRAGVSFPMTRSWSSSAGTTRRSGCPTITWGITRCTASSTP